MDAGNISKSEVERKIGYLEYALSKLESQMLKEQSERMDLKHRLGYLQLLQKQVKLAV